MQDSIHKTVSNYMKDLFQAAMLHGHGYKKPTIHVEHHVSEGLAFLRTVHIPIQNKWYSTQVLIMVKWKEVLHS